MLHISLFSGIGGFDLAAQWAGWTNVASCEIAEFPRKVLQYHFPQAYHHDDIHTLTYEKLDHELETRFGKGWRADDIVLSGGFPCQPYSLAGKRLGKEDDRHLWPEMLRVIREVQPRWVVGENVFGLVNWNGGLVFDEVHSDLEAAGYEVQAFILPAASVGAPHRRDRVWFVAHANHERRNTGLGEIQKTDGEVSERHNNAKFSNTSDDFASYPTGDRWQRSREGFEVKEGLQQEPGTAGELEGGLEGFCGERITPNADGRNCFGWPESRERWTNGAWLYGSKEFTSNTDGSIGRKRRMHTEEPEATDGYISSCNALCKSIPNWNNFPTQSPVCGGNDGVSSRLDNITFSKWRNESIKAYGNAVVPQVVYQIFRTINDYENSVF